MKSLMVDKPTHTAVKKHCMEKGVKLEHFTKEALLEKLKRDSDPKEKKP